MNSLTLDNLNVDKFCKAILHAFEAEAITGEEALDLIKGFWKTLCEEEIRNVEIK